MKFESISINFCLDNSAFWYANRDRPSTLNRNEIDRILSRIAVDVLNRDEGTIKDINGNTVGSWALQEDING